MSQAIAMMTQIGGYGTLTEEAGSVTTDTAAEAFLTEGLSKVLKINNICDSEHLTDCGVPETYTNIAGSNIAWPKTISKWNNHFVNFSISLDFGKYSYSQTDTKAAAFETQNGETIVLYYNPKCTDNIETSWHYPQSKMCANFIYDLNGNKGPNTVGKDIGFITALYPTNPNVVAPIPLTIDATNTDGVEHQVAGAACTAQDAESRLPSIDELTSLYFNRNLVNMPSGSFWSSSVVSSNYAWRQDFLTGPRTVITRSTASRVCCIKR